MDELPDTHPEVQNPQAGEVWFVQLPGEVVVFEVHVLEMTEKTCLVRDVIKLYMESRYRPNEIKWVELSDRIFRR